MTRPSVNRGAFKIVREMLDNPDFFSVTVSQLSSKATVIDGSRGTYEFGRLLGEICMGGLGTCQFVNYSLKGRFLPGLLVQTSNPAIALIGSQKATRLSVKIKTGDKEKKHSYMVSGPFRAKSGLDQELFDLIEYSDDAMESVMVFEIGSLPDEIIMDQAFSKCKLTPEHTVVIFAPSNSVAGSIQVAARVMKTGVHILREQGFNPNQLKHAMGITSIAPVAKDEVQAMGRTNDSIIYGGQVFFTVDVHEDEEPQLVEMLKKSPSIASSSYGKPFYEMLKDVNFDFYQIDGKLFAPAILTVNNLRTGNTFTEGRVNEEVLWRSYF